MEEEARKRRERLQAIREGRPIEEVHPEQPDLVEDLAVINPKQIADDTDAQETIKASTSIFAGDRTLEAQTREMLADLKDWKDPVAEQGQITLEALAPKKANWDLKEEYERRTAGLRKQYDRACIELIHESFEKEAMESPSPQ